MARRPSSSSTPRRRKSQSPRKAPRKTPRKTQQQIFPPWDMIHPYWEPVSCTWQEIPSPPTPPDPRANRHLREFYDDLHPPRLSSPVRLAPPRQLDNPYYDEFTGTYIYNNAPRSRRFSEDSDGNLLNTSLEDNRNIGRTLYEDHLSNGRRMDAYGNQTWQFFDNNDSLDTSYSSLPTPASMSQFIPTRPVGPIQQPNLDDPFFGGGGLTSRYGNQGVQTRTTAPTQPVGPIQQPNLDDPFFGGFGTSRFGNQGVQTRTTGSVRRRLFDDDSDNDSDSDSMDDDPY